LAGLQSARLAENTLAVPAAPIIISRMINNRRWLVLPLLGAGSVAAATSALPSCEKRQIRAEDHLQGVVELDERTLALEVGGRVDAVRVRRGDYVAAGQELVALDAELLETAVSVRSAEAQAASAQTELLQAGTRPEEIRSMASQVKSARASEQNLERMLSRERALSMKGVTTQASVDDLQSRLDAARANRQSLEHKLASLRRGARPEEIETARARARAADSSAKLEQKRVERHVLKAPISGTVLDVHVESGEIVGAGTPVVSLGDTKRPYVDVFVPIDALDGVQVGTKGSVRVDATDRSFPARVDWVARKTEFTPRFLFSERERPNLVVRVRLLVDDPEQRLHAGVPAFASLETPALSARARR
jgi:HlyD family secretion protein